jgi:uncharacterized SAM-binding protein YcdF (DUF218 family)
LRGLRRIGLLAFVLLLLALTHSLWLNALGGYLIRAENPAPADMIVVPAGDFSGQRILKAAEMVKAGFAPQVLVSGPGDTYGLHETDLAIPFAVRHGYPEAWFVAAPNGAKSTREEAKDLLPELRRRNVHRIDLVTSNYHTRRAGGVYRSLAPDIEVHVVAASDKYFEPGSWWKNREGQKTFVMEWMKTIAYWVGM